MGDGSTIEWTEATWNPLVGCAHVGPGCDHCYAAKEAAGRLSGNPTYRGLATRAPGKAARFTGEVRLLPERLDQPLRWQRPRRIFVNSMSDLFHQDVPADFIHRVVGVMVQARRHQFQVLTKRPQRMARLFRNRPATPEEVDAGCELGSGPGLWDVWTSGVPAPNVCLGTSIENDSYAFRADHLRATPAAVRFLSLEPLLGPLPSLDLAGIDWVIVGGESGPGARPMHPDWARDLRDRCVAAGVAFFFKQWGQWGSRQDSPASDRTGVWLYPDGSTSTGVLSEPSRPGRPAAMFPMGKKAAGRLLDGRTWDEMPAVFTGG